MKILKREIKKTAGRKTPFHKSMCLRSVYSLLSFVPLHFATLHFRSSTSFRSFHPPQHRTARVTPSFLLSFPAPLFIPLVSLLINPRPIKANKHSSIHPFRFVQSFSRYTCLSRPTHPAKNII